MATKAGYLGPEGSYSQFAAQTLCKDSVLIPYVGFRALFSALTNGEVNYIVIPVENTVNGAVTQNLDLLEETKGVFATACCEVALDHRLITKKGADISKVTKVYSHIQALEQCDKFLSEKLPNAQRLETASTADSIKMLTDEYSAGIVGAHLKVEGMQLSKETVSDEKNNFTTFLKVVKGDPEKLVLQGCSKLLFCFTLRHEAGSLSKTLAYLADYGLNMTKIESRPIKDKKGEFRFFVETESAKVNSPAALTKIRAHSLSFKLLGAY